MGSHSTIYYPSAPALGIGIGLTGHRANMRPHSALLCYPLRSQSTLRTWEQPICRSVRSGFQRAPYRHPALEAPGSNAHPTGILPCAVCRVRAAAGDVFTKEGVGRLHACQRKQRPVTMAIPSLSQGPGPECDHGAAQAPLHQRQRVPRGWPKGAQRVRPEVTEGGAAQAPLHQRQTERQTEKRTA